MDWRDGGPKGLARALTRRSLLRIGAASRWDCGEASIDAEERDLRHGSIELTASISFRIKWHLYRKRPHDEQWTWC